MDLCRQDITTIKVPGGVVRRALMVMFRYGELLRKQSQDTNKIKYIYKIRQKLIWKDDKRK